jgi:hypothetical protein
VVFAEECPFNSYPVIQDAYGTQANFASSVANAFIQNPAIRAAYVSVDELLEGANVARSDIYNDYLHKFELWATSNEVFLGQDATNIADLMKSGLTDITMPTTVNRQSWIERLLSSIVAVGASAAGALGIPGASLAITAVGNVYVNLIDAWLEDKFGNAQKLPVTSSKDILGAAIDMQTTALDTYKNTFDSLTNQDFLTSVFSNYGLLEALGTIQFTYSAGDAITPAAVLRQNYDRSIWEQLLPRAFSWRLVAPTDNGPADTLPNFTFFIPYNEKAQWESPDDAQPLHDGGPDGWDYYPKNGRHTFELQGGGPQAIADAKSEVVALQSGTASIPFPGYDFTPSANDKDDWFGPGPVSTAQTITGYSDRFYTLSTNSHLSEKLYRQAYNVGPYNLYGYKHWYTWADLDGITIHQWALETPDGKGGYLELSQDAAAALFGTGPLVTASPDPVAYKGGGSYFDFEVPADGLATRFEVFTQWGKDTPGYAPSSLQPAATLNAGNMHVGLNPNNYFKPFLENSYVTTYNLTYDSSRVRSMRRPSGVPKGLGPGSRLARRT